MPRPPHARRGSSERLRTKAAALNGESTIDVTTKVECKCSRNLNICHCSILHSPFPVVLVIIQFCQASLNPPPLCLPNFVSADPTIPVLPTQPFLFLKLPAELRLMVYAYLTPHKVQIGISNWADHIVQETQLSEKLGKECLVGEPRTHDLRFLAVCQQMYQEIAPLIYRETVVVIYMLHDEPFLRKETRDRTEYSLRSRNIVARGVIYPSILKRFQHIQINYGLPGMHSAATTLTKDWKEFDASLLEVCSIISQGSNTNPFKTELCITFWEPSRLLFAFENASTIYTQFLRTMNALQDTIPPAQFNQTFIMKKDLLNVAITYSAHRHLLQLEIMKKEHATLTKIQKFAQKGDVDVRAARDWRLCAFLSASAEWLSCSWEAAVWDYVFLPEPAGLVSDASLVELIASAPERVVGENWKGRLGPHDLF